MAGPGDPTDVAARSCSRSAAGVAAPAALVRRQGPLGRVGRGRRPHPAAHRGRPAARPGAAGRRVRRRRAGAALPAAGRRAARVPARGAGARDVRRRRRAGRLRRAVGHPGHRLAAGRDPGRPHGRRRAVRAGARREDRRRAGGPGARGGAVQHLGVLGRAVHPQAVPPGAARGEPRPGAAPGAALGGQRAGGVAAGRGRGQRWTASRSRWPCCRTTPRTPPRAGRWPWPACATCSPRATCAPTRWAATSRPRPPGSARRSPWCTTSCAGRWAAPSWTRPSWPRPGSERLDHAAAEVVPSWPSSVEPIRAVYDRVAELADPVPTQRVHGDLHLGQTLRTPLRLAGDRLRGRAGGPRSPTGCGRTRRCATWPACCARSTTPPTTSSRSGSRRSAWSEPDHNSQLSWRANEWAARNRSAFCDGYAPRRGRRPAGAGRPAARVRAGQGRVRGAVRDPQPADLGRDPAGLDHAG